MKLSTLVTTAIFAIILASCGSTEKIPYMTDADKISKESLAKATMIYEAKIMPKDVLQISVNTTVPEAAAPFNLGSNAGSGVTTVTGGTIQGATLQTYIVDKHGEIDYPVVGKLKVAGLTRVELQDMIKNKIHPAYITESPIVNVRFQNYKISVLGEVAHPGTYTLQNEQCTIFDALSLAGDLTIYGKRENVMLIRENGDGSKTISRIDLQKTDIITNPSIYYLQQNDVLYIEPNKTKARTSKIGSAETFTIAIVSTLISIATLLATTLK